ncbi:hypothetical protein NA56DRAFT_698991 [Hyaloscypha hepaticicola]|uniref:Uncharacterized protein n=1 Tax=Hyaloscypha hepaticicola TaxID=2082293 RepID=A0A2J6QI32_9HELO|nr:hypothetical protein NA56DRAFT_698991 [Hyaloscypha hepaticicola]
MRFLKEVALFARLGLAKPAVSTPHQTRDAAQSEDPSPFVGGPPPGGFKLVCSSPIQTTVTTLCEEDGYSCSSSGALNKPDPTVPGSPRLRSWEDCYIWRIFTEIVTVAIRHTSHACRTTGFRLRIRRLAVATTSQAKGAGLRLTASELLFPP